MVELVEANWLLILLGFLIGLAIAWYVFNVRRRTRITADRRDVLDEGAERATRNQALVDAPARPEAEPRAPPVEPLERTAAPAPAPPPPAPDEPAEDFTPRTTASIVTPGAIVGAEAAANLAAHQGEAIGRAEQAEVDHFRRAEAPAEIDDLLRIKGVGPKLMARLHELGITSFAQIAGWDDAEIDRVDAELGRFQGRIRRDDWVTQARLLQEGDTVEYEEKFGRL